MGEKQPRGGFSMMKVVAVLCLALGISLTAQAQYFSDNPEKECTRIASQSQNVPLLIIGIEGTLQYRSGDADDLYSYARARKAGPVRESLPRLEEWSGGVLTKGLLFPLLRKFGEQAYAVSFDLDFERDLPQAVECAKLWMRVPGHRLMIIGHSSGGQESLRLVEHLRARRIPVGTLVTIDSIPLMGTLARPRGVARYLNFYQSVGYLRGQPVKADINRQVRDVQGHLTVTASPTIFKYVSRRVSEELVVETKAKGKPHRVKLADAKK